MSVVLVVLSVLCCVLALTMLFAKNPITSALCLLGVLVLTAGIYGVIGEHMVATIQLVVYAGAIMVLFIFSIMLLNLDEAETDFRKKPLFFYSSLALGAAIFACLGYAVNEYFANHTAQRKLGIFTPEAIAELGGNAKVMSHALFSQYYVSFEVISLVLLTAVVGAVVLAKRKFD